MKMDWQSLLINESFGVLPAILQLVEIIHARQPGEPTNGNTKLGAAVQLAQTVLTIAAAQGAISNSDAQDIPVIVDLVRQTVANQQAQGKLGGSKSTAPDAPSTLQPAPLALQPSGLKPPTTLPFSLAGALARTKQ